MDTQEGPARLPHPIEFEPAPAGTTIHADSRHRRPSASGRSPAEIGSADGPALESGVPRLFELLEAETAARESSVPEPDIAMPRPDGPIAGLQLLSK